MIELLNYTSADGFKLFGKSLNKENLSNIRETISPKNLLGNLDKWWNGDSSNWEKTNPIPDLAGAQANVDRFNQLLEEHETVEKLIESTDDLNESEKKYLRTKKLSEETGQTYIDFLKEENRQIEANNKKYQGFKGTLKDVGKSMLAMGGNILADLAISWVVGKIIEGFQKLANAQEDAIKKATELREEYDTQTKTINEGRKTISEIGREYVNLNKYYDSTGKNIRLTDDELERHQELTSQIASILPELIIGYDSLGNPILKTVDSVQQLNDALDEQEKKLNRDIVSDGEAIFDGFNATVTKQKKWPWEEAGIQEKINAANSLFNRTAMGWTADGTMPDALKTVLDEMDVDKEYKLHPEKIAKDEEMRKQVQNYIASLMIELDEQNENIAQYANAFLELHDNFSGLNDTTKTILSNVLTNYDYAGNGKNTQKSVNDLIYGIMENVPSNEVVILEAIEKLNSARMNKDITAKEWNAIVSQLFSDLTSITGIDGKSLAFALDVEISDTGEVLKDGKSVQDMLDALNERFGETNKEFEKMSFEDLSKAYDVALNKTDEFTGSLEQLKKRLELVQETSSSLTFTDYQTALDNANPGATYLSIDEALKATKEAWDKGLIGTDEFKTFAQLISPKQYKDEQKYIDNYLKNYKNMQKYFTEDHTGPKKLLDQLVKLGDIDKKSDGSYIGMIEDTTEAAKELGLSTYAFEQILNRLKDYGFDIDFNSVTDSVVRANEEIAKLQNIWSETKDVQEKAALGEEIEDYKQQVLEFSNAGKEIPDYLIKEIEFKVTYTTSDAELDSMSAIIDSMINGEDKATKLAEYIANSSASISSMKNSLGIYSSSDIKDKNIRADFDRYSQDLENYSAELSEAIDTGAPVEKIISIQEKIKTCQDGYREFLKQLSENPESSGLEKTSKVFGIIADKLKNPTENVDKLIEKLKEIGITAENLNSIDFSDGELAEGELGEFETIFDTLLSELGLSQENVEDLKTALLELDTVKVKPEIEVPEYTPTPKKEEPVVTTPEVKTIDTPVRNKIKEFFGSDDTEVDTTIKLDTKDFDSSAQQVIDKTIEIDKLTATPEINTSKLRPVVSLLTTIKTKWNNLFTKNNTPTPPTQYGNVNGNAYGTFNTYSNGTDVTIPKDQTALVNELDNEGLVRDGVLTEMKGPAHFEKLKRGDIIFNHKQMKELKKTGKVSSSGGRGRLIGSFAKGTVLSKAYNSTNLNGKFGGGLNTSDSSSKNSSDKASKKVSKSIDNLTSKLDKLFDWTEIKLERLSSKTDKWTTAAENAVDNSKKASYYNKAVDSTLDEIKANRSATSKYLSKTQSVGKEAVKGGLISNKEYKDILNKLENGALDIKSYDENKRTVISEMQEWYDKALSTSDAVTSLTDSLQDLYNEARNLVNVKAEEKIEKLNNELEILELKADNAVSANSKNKQIDKQNEIALKTLNAYKTAAKDANDQYKADRKKIDATDDKALKGLSKKDKNYITDKVAKGEKVEINDKWSEKAKKAISAYNASLDANATAAHNANVAQQEYTATLRENAMEKFNNISQRYENRRIHSEHRMNLIDSAMSKAEADGYRESSKYYERQKREQEIQKAEYTTELDGLRAQLDSALASGHIRKYSQEWYDMMNQIYATEEAVAQCESTTAELNNQIEELQWENAKKLREEMQAVIDDSNFMIDELSRQELADNDAGTLTDEGRAVMGLHVDNYAMYGEQLKSINSELAALDEKYKNDPLNERYLARRKELLSTQKDIVSSMEDEKFAAIEVAEQGYAAQMAYLENLINEYKELMEVQKEASDYQKDISDMVKGINNTKKQLQVLAGDTSEENRAKIQQLTLSLEDQQQSLAEKRQDKLTSDINNMFDDLTENFSDYTQEVISNLDENFGDLEHYISGYSTQICKTIQALATGLNVTNTDDFNKLIGESSAEEVVTGIKQRESKKISDADTNATSDVAKIKSQTDLDSVRASLISGQLSKGSTGTDVMTLQKALAQINGVSLIPSGTFDTTTENMLKKFQGVSGIPQTGILDDATKKALKDKGYAKGISNLKSNSSVWTHQGEIFYRKSDGAMLTPLGNGSKIFTAEMAENLWNMAHMDYANNFSVTPVDTVSSAGDVSINIGDIILPDVTDVNQFANELKNVIKNDSSVQKMFRNITIDTLGKQHNSLSVRKY